MEHTQQNLSFQSFNFEEKENKDFANCMFRYALLEFDGSHFAKLMSGLKLQLTYQWISLLT